MKKSLLVVSVVSVLSACGGESSFVGPGSTIDSSADMLETGAAMSESVNESVVATNTDAAVTIANELTLPVASTESDSKALVVADSFAFNTARTIDVDFDLAQARGYVAQVSICTEFDPQGGVFGVNYDSCTVQGKMENGVFHHSMEVTNDVESVAGVVWFEDNAAQPLMQEFSVNVLENSKDRSTLSLSTPRIVWR